tara:strand:+ start:305 stop:1558 length:1254 start_codon:yes stop_codon:yes gene_type:complete
MFSGIGLNHSQIDQREVVIVAHRGGRFDSANSLAGIKKAINYAQLHQSIPFMIEIDVQQCKADHGQHAGRLVVIHDSTVNNTTNKTGRVSHYTFDELRAMTLRPPKKQIDSSVFKDVGNKCPFVIPVSPEDRRIPSLQEVLDVLDIVNKHRIDKGISLIGLGIDFTHVAGRVDRFKDHFLYPLLEKLRPGSQLRKVSTPKMLLRQLAHEISIRNDVTPIQVISQGIHGRRNLGVLLNLLEESSIKFSVALQASTSYFPADIRGVKSSLGLYEDHIEELIKDNRFTINYNHKWDRLTHNLRRFTGFNIVNPFSLLPARIATNNQQAMAVASEEGFKTGFWTVNSKNAIRDVVKWGADMVTTDYPPRAVDIIEAVFGCDIQVTKELVANSPDELLTEEFEPVEMSIEIEEVSEEVSIVG